MHHLLRSLIKEHLSSLLESPDTSRLAASVRHSQTSDGIEAVIYHPQLLLGAVDQNFDLLDEAQQIKTLSTAVKGYVLIEPTPPSMGKCWDAWFVSMSYGPGLGQLVYDIAFALSPSGLLISDRHTVSQMAQSRWSKIAGDKSRNRLPLDDINHDPSPFHDQHHTPDTDSDDCTITKNDILNYAYKSRGDEKQSLHRMLSLHKSTLNDLPFDPDLLEDPLFKSASLSFASAFSSADDSGLVHSVSSR